MKKVNESVDELTKKEISLVETNDKLAKLEKDKQRKDKLISEYKEREKQSARALVLYERKIKWIKETIIDDILKVCKGIENNKAEYLAQVDKILNQEMKEDFRSFSANFALIEDDLYDVCNKLETGLAITQSDRDFISNKAETKKQPEKLDSDARFNMLKKQFDQKIGASVLRKPGRPRKSEQSIVSEIGLGKNPENKIKETEDVQEKLNNIFYETPENKNVVSNIPQTDDSMFDFNEALNPNVSLKSIMADIMEEKPQDDIKNYNLHEQTQEIKNAQKKSKIELLEAGFFRKPMFFEDTKPKSENSQGVNETLHESQEHVVNYSGKINSSRGGANGTAGLYDNKKGLNDFIEEREREQKEREQREKMQREQRQRTIDTSVNYQEVRNNSSIETKSSNDRRYLENLLNNNSNDGVNIKNVNNHVGGNVNESRVDLNGGVSQTRDTVVASEIENIESTKPKLTFEQKFMPLKDLINGINDEN